ncbi:uncharacterized protein LOC143211562 isoform X2 [Lasioglossum baleicum]|uniref:uncharacterized protein LOC143211562 isoform X2 n=1 Tax=Lasioglossum baleicum TaxID=434251 RepID=UPI003FCDCDAF
MLPVATAPFRWLVTGCMKQQFCEEIGPWSSNPAKMDSLWSQWSSPKCNNTCGRGYMVAITSCQDQVTGKPAIDCIGPGSFCCPDSFGKCYCEVNMVDGIMRAARFTEPCISTEGCTKSDAGTFTFEGEYDPSGSADFDQAYEDDDSERFDDTLFYSESVRPSQRRRLLRVYRANEEYELRENRSPNKNLKNTGGYHPNARGRLDDYSDYTEEDDDDDDDGSSDDSNVGDEGDGYEAEEEYEDEEEISKGRRRPRKQARVPRSDHKAIAFESKREVNEPEREGAMQIASAEDDCEDDTTEPLIYYDYGEETSPAAELRLNHSDPLHTASPERSEHLSRPLSPSDWLESSYGIDHADTLCLLVLEPSFSSKTKFTHLSRIF